MNNQTTALAMAGHREFSPKELTNTYEKQIALMQVQRNYLEKLYREVMIEGLHYGPAWPGSKLNSILKPGVELILSPSGMFKLHVDTEIVTSTEDWTQDRPLFAYTIKAFVLGGDGQPIAHAFGSCNNREKRYMKSDAAGLQNTCLKMAEIRAERSLALKVGCASSFFSQDFVEEEDMEEAAGPAAGPKEGGGQRGAPATSDQRSAFCDLMVWAYDNGLINKDQFSAGITWTSKDVSEGTIGRQIREWRDKREKWEEEGATEEQAKSDGTPPVQHLPSSVTSHKPSNPISNPMAAEKLCLMHEEFKNMGAEEKVGEKFLSYIEINGKALGVDMAYPLVKLRTAANSFDAEKFGLSPKNFPYADVPVHCAIGTVEFVADKAGVELEV